jgi:hypothetical protein
LLQHVARLVTRLGVDYFDYAARPGASARRAARHAARRAACCQLRLRRASECLGTSRGSSSTTSPTLRVRVPRHVARLVAPLIVNFDYTTRLSASGRHATRRAARRRLLLLHCASGCLGMSRNSSRRSLSTSTTPHVRVPRHVTWLVVDYFAYAVRLGASARHAARCRLLRLRCAFGCLGTSRGSSSTTSPRTGSSSITSPTPSIRVPRHVARLVIDHMSSRRSTSRRSVALALTVRPIAPSRGSTTPCRHSTCCPVTLARLQPRRA